MVYCRKQMNGVQAVDSKVYEYESLIYEAGGQGSGDGKGTGIKEG